MSDGEVIIEIDGDGRGFEDELDRVKGAADKTAGAVGNLGNASDRAGNSFDDLGDGAGNAKDKVNKFGKEGDSATLKLAAMSAALLKVTSEFIGMGAAAVETASEAEAAFAKVQTIVDSTVSTGAMRADIQALSTTSGMASADVSEAVYSAISGSVATADAVSFVNQANMLAVSGFTSLGNATDVLTTTLNAYKMSADQVGGISNVLIRTQNLGKITVDELATAMGRAISTGSAYGVNLQNLASAYVEITRAGVPANEATTYLSGMLNELGNASSKVGTILQEETGSSFGQLMAQGYSLGDVLQVLSDKCNGNAEAMMGLWGSQEAGKGANTIMTAGVQDFNSVLLQMNSELAGATGTTEEAFATMSSTSAFIDQQYRNAVNNLGVAFGNNLSPAVDGVKQMLTSMANGLAEAVEKYPALTGVVAAATAGLGAMGIVLTVYAIKAKLATIETAKLAAAKAVLKGIINPTSLLITGTVALAAGLIAHASAAKAAADETENLSNVSKAQADHIKELKMEYDALCESEGAASAEAQLLKDKIDDQTAAFEKNKQTQEEYNAQQQKQAEAIKQRRDAYDDSIDKMDAEYAGTTSLIERLNALTDAETVNAAAKKEIVSIVDILNDRIPELGLNYDALTNSLSMSPEDIQAATSADYRKKKAKADYEALGAEIYTRDQLNTDLSDATDARKAAEKRLADYNASIPKDDPDINPTDRKWTAKEAQIAAERDRLQAAVDDTKKKESDLQTKYDESIAEVERLTGEITGAAEESAEAMGEVGAILDDYRSKLDDVTAAYNESYEAAYKSITGQFELWDTAPTVVAKSVDSMIASMDSQTKYWTNYTSNLNLIDEWAAKIPGLRSILDGVNAGDTEAVNMVAGIADALNSGDTSKVEEMVTSYERLKTAEDEASQAFGNTDTGYKEQVQKMAEEIAAGIGELNIDQDAYNLGVSAIQELVSGANGELGTVSSAFESLGRLALDSLLRGLNIGVGPVYRPVGKNPISMYASGTASAAAGYAIVGEKGPELVRFRGGEQVLTASETRTAMNAVYPTLPGINYSGHTAPGTMGRGTVQLQAEIRVPLAVDGREFAIATAEYMGEEMYGEVL